MSQETNVDQMESCDNVESNIVNYSTRFVEQTIERALDIIFEQTNYMNPQIYEWRHSADKIIVLSD